MGARTRYGIVVLALEVQFWFPVWLLFLLDRGITTEQASVADGVFRLIATVFEVPVGWFSDRIGRKRSLYLALIGTFITFLLIAYVHDLPSLFIAWSVWGLVWALVSGLLTAYGWELGSQIEGNGPATATEFIRIRRVCAALAMIVSLISAGALYDVSPALPFLITGVVAVAVIPVAWGLPDIKRTVVQTNPTCTSLVKVPSGEVRWAIVAGSIVLISGWSIQMVFQPVGLEASLTPKEISLLFAGFGLAQLIGAWFVGKLPFARRTVLVVSVVGIALMCLGVWLGFMLELSVWIPLVLLVSLGIFYSVGTAYCDIWVSKLSSTSNRATMLSLVSLLGGVVMVFTRPLLGFISGGVSASAACGIWGAVCFAFAFGLWLLLVKKDSQSVRKS